MKENDLLRKLDDPNTPWEELVPILDELDEKEGAVPFDTQAGWADLMARTPKKKRGWRKIPLAAVVALVCLMTTVAAGSFGLHEKLADFFGAGEDQTTLLTEGVSQPKAVMLPGAVDGVKIDIIQVVADRSSMFVLYEATFPKSVVLPKDKDWVMEWQTAYADPPKGGNSALSMGNEILEVKRHSIIGILNTYCFRPVLETGWASAKFQDLGYWENETFIPLMEGAWHLYWNLDSIALGTTFHLDQSIQGKRGVAVVTDISLSPVSILLQVIGPEIQEDEIYLEFQDGTLWNLCYPDSRNYSWGYNQLDEATRIACQFDSPIDPDQVTAVIIEGNRIPIS